MAEPSKNRTEAEWVFLPDEDEEFDPEEYGEIRILEDGPQSVEEWSSLGKAMEGGGIDTVITDDWVWRAQDWGPMPEGIYHINEHPFAETVASGWTGGEMYTRLWGLSRIGDDWFEWHDSQEEFGAFCSGSLQEAVEQSDYFRLTPTGHVVPADVGDDELVDFLRAEGTVVPDAVELGALRHVPFPLVEALRGHLDSDDGADSSDDLDTIVSELLAVGITEDEARTIMLTGCRREPVPVLNFIRALGPAADELVDRRDDIHDLIDWVEGRARSAGISVLEAYDQAPLSTSFPGFTTKAEGAAIAAENGDIIRAGGYTTSSGRFVDLSTRVAAAVEGTTTFTPEELAALPAPTQKRGRGLVTVANETTLIGALRIDDGNVGCLNFASARAVGGGYRSGSRAQEESLCRESALYPCLASQELAYHEANRAAQDVVGLWTDTMIHSPGVPVFRSPGWDLLEEPFAVSFVTAPAPSFSRVADDAKGLVPATFERRIDLLFRCFKRWGIAGSCWGRGGAVRTATIRRWWPRPSVEPSSPAVGVGRSTMSISPCSTSPTTRTIATRSWLSTEPLGTRPRAAGRRRAERRSQCSNDRGSVRSSTGIVGPQRPEARDVPEVRRARFPDGAGREPMGKAFVSSRCLDCGWVESRQVSGSGAERYAAGIREEQERWHEEHGKRPPS